MRNLQDRTRTFALDILTYCGTLPNQPPYWTLGRQLIRSATSVGANYRAAQHARSRKEFIAKLGVVEEEADESQYWLELLQQVRTEDIDTLKHLHQEAGELVRIIIASIRTARRNE